MGRRKLIVVMLLAGVAQQPVHAQNDDVVVMRRAVAAPKITPTPTVPTDPTPATPTPSTPTPAPVPTPTVTPTPTQSNYEKVATLAILQATTLPYASANRPTYQGTLSYSTNAAGVTCRNRETRQSVSTSLCDNIANPSSVGTQTVAATYQPTHRIAVIDRQALLARSPDLTNLDAVCAQTVTFAVSGGASESWKVSCNPVDIQGDYVAFGVKSNVMLMNDPDHNRNSFPGGANYNRDIPINPHLWEGICRKVSTGEDVPLSNCSTSGPPLYVPGVVNPQTRFIYINFDDMLRIMPEHRDREAFCASTGPMQSSNNYGTVNSFSYKVRCDPHSVDMHYEYVPTRGLPTTTLTGNVHYSTDLGYDVTGPLKISTTTFPVCKDTDNGQTVDASICANIPPGRVGTFEITATYSAAYRKVLINWNDILALVPNAQVQSATCDMDVNISGTSSAGYTKFRTTCNPADLRRHHTVIATRAAPQNSFKTEKTFSQLTTTSPDFTMTQNIVVSVNGRCIDTDNGQDLGASEATGSPCLFIADSEEAKLRPYSFTISPSRKTVTFRWADILANSPNIANKAEFCARTGITILDKNYSTGASNFKMVCE